jgi:hypothetical protein
VLQLSRIGLYTTIEEKHKCVVGRDELGLIAINPIRMHSFLEMQADIISDMKSNGYTQGIQRFDLRFYKIVF